MSETVAQMLQKVDPDRVMGVVMKGDLTPLSAIERLWLYNKRCEDAGIDPASGALQFIEFKAKKDDERGKLVLYATKSATDQLIAKHKLTVTMVARELYEATGIYVVTARVTFPDGHAVEDMGAVSMTAWDKPLKGEGLANAYMKAATKAKRRVVLSACGLGMLDETEVETVDGAVVVPMPTVGESPALPTTVVKPKASTKPKEPEVVVDGQTGEVVDGQDNLVDIASASPQVEDIEVEEVAIDGADPTRPIPGTSHAPTAGNATKTATATKPSSAASESAADIAQARTQASSLVIKVLKEAKIDYKVDPKGYAETMYLLMDEVLKHRDPVKTVSADFKKIYDFVLANPGAVVKAWGEATGRVIPF